MRWKHAIVLALACVGLILAAPDLFWMGTMNHRADVCKRDLVALGGLDRIMADPNFARPGGLGCAERPRASPALAGFSRPGDAERRWDVIAALVSGDYPAAKSLAVDGLRIHPADDQYLTLAGVAAQAAGNTSEALLYWRGLDNAELAVLGMADRLAASGDLPQALNYYRATALAFPSSQDAHLKLAEALYAAQLWTKAREQYEVAFGGLSGGRLVDQAAARYHQAMILSAAGAHRDAVVALKDALRIDPGYPPYADALGQEYAAIGDNANAERWLDAAVRLAPNSGQPYWEYGRYYLTRNRPAMALPEFQQAVALEPGGPGYYYGYLGATYAALRDYDHAVPPLQEALRREPTNQLYRQWLDAAVSEKQRRGARA